VRDRIPADYWFPDAFTLRCNDQRKRREEEYDSESEAVAAMQMAAATTRVERLKWVRVAQAGLDIGHHKPGRNAARTECSWGTCGDG
jgi:hypothetical protein